MSCLIFKKKSMEGVPKRKEEAAGARALVAWTGESHF
jgi:hypothetical protein